MYDTLAAVAITWLIASVLAAAAFLAVKLAARRRTPPAPPTPTWPAGRAPVETTTAIPAVAPRPGPRPVWTPPAPRPAPRTGRHRPPVVDDATAPVPYVGFDNPLRTPGGDAQ